MQMFKRTKSIRLFLLIFLILSSVYAAYSIYHKTSLWGFSINPKQTTDVWTIEAQISFVANGEPIKASFARPTPSNEFMILSEDVVASGYKTEKTDDRIILTSSTKKALTHQNLYYRTMLYSFPSTLATIPAFPFDLPTDPVLSEQQKEVFNQLLETSKQYPGDRVQQIVSILIKAPSDPAVETFTSQEKKSPREIAETALTLLALEKIPGRIVRGIRMTEGKKTFNADFLIEAQTNGTPNVYSLEDASKGIPHNFIIFQRGGQSMLDLEGGIDSSIKFSVLRSLRSAFSMARHRTKNIDENTLTGYKYSIYNLPVDQQNALKLLMIFPLAIFMIAVIRNIIGLKTMGTFTPMLIALALISSGFVAGLVCFAIIITAGLIMRMLFARFNLLLVPRISAVVICVILIIQVFSVLGYHADFKIASSALFFPIIIMAWIIERASIIFEEEGAKNAVKEILFTTLAGILTYFVVASETIRHIMFAFNELNLVILALVMLLGTYTGYRLTELIRFAPLVKKRVSPKKAKPRRKNASSDR